MACKITSDEYNDDFPHDEADPGLHAIYCNLWFFYSDYAHKLEGKHELTSEQKELFGRCALFLGSNLEYEWPPFKWISLKYGLMRLVGLGKRIDQSFEEFKKSGDYEVWPFARREDYLRAASQASC